VEGVDVPEDGSDERGDGAPKPSATPLLRSSGMLLPKVILLGVEAGLTVVGVVEADGVTLLFALALPLPLKLDNLCSSCCSRVTLPSCECTPRVNSLEIEAVAVDVPASAGTPTFKDCCKRRGGLEIRVQSSDGDFTEALCVSRILRSERIVCFVGHESEESSLPSGSVELRYFPPPSELDTSKGGVILRFPDKIAGKEVNPYPSGLGVCDLDLDPEPAVTVLLEPEPPDIAVLVDVVDAAGEVECLLPPLYLLRLDSNMGFSATAELAEPRRNLRGEFLPFFIREIDDVEFERLGIGEDDREG
jgi:hypothetical protein